VKAGTQILTTIPLVDRTSPSLPLRPQIMQKQAQEKSSDRWSAPISNQNNRRRRKFVFFPNTFLSSIVSAPFTGVIRTFLLYTLYEPKQVRKLRLWTEFQIWSASSLMAMLIVGIIRYYAGWTIIEDQTLGAGREKPGENAALP